LEPEILTREDKSVEVQIKHLLSSINKIKIKLTYTEFKKIICQCYELK